MTFHGYRGPHRQRGVIGLLGVMVMLLVVLCIALALDTGRLYMEQRNLQRVADLAALSVVSSCRYLDACDESEQEGYARQAAAENGYTLNLSSDSEDEEDSLVAGKVFVEDGRYGFDGSAETRDAVRVELNHQVPTSLINNLAALMPGYDIEPSTTLHATAVARQRNGAVTFSVGSGLLTTEESDLLKTLLGDDVIIDALSYDGLVNASLSIADLVGLSAMTGSKDGLLQDAELDLGKISVADLEAVSCADGACDSDTVLGLQLFKDAIDGFVNLGLEPVRLGELIAVDSTTPTEALQTEVGLQQLLHTMVLMGNGQFLKIDNLKASVGTLTNVELLLDVVESPRIAVGQAGCLDGTEGNCQGEWITEARTAQLRVGIVGSVRVPLLADVNLRVGIFSAGARAGVDQVDRTEDDGYELTVSAYQKPLDVRLGIDVTVLSDRYISEVVNSSDLVSGGLSGLGILSEDDLVLDVIQEAESVVGDLLNTVSQLIGGKQTRVNPDDPGEVQYRNCLLNVICSGPWDYERDATTVQGELGTSGGSNFDWSGASLDSWVTSGDAAWRGSRMRSDVVQPVRYTAGEFNENPVSFSGEASDVTENLSSSLENIDLKLNVLGMSASEDESSLLNPVVGLINEVLSRVLSDVVADQLLEPLLGALGVQVGTAEVHIVDVQPSRGGGELVL